MQYYLCPRCRFKVSANKRICHTCGLNIAADNGASTGASNDAGKSTKTAVWSKFLGFDVHRDKKSTQEKPALG